MLLVYMLISRQPVWCWERPALEAQHMQSTNRPELYEGHKKPPYL